MDSVTVYLLKTSLIEENLDYITSFVDEDRKEKALKFASKQDQLLSFGAGYLMKKYLPNKEYRYTEYGKPYFIDGPYFNVSHSGEYVVLAISYSRDIGVDIEKINEKKLDGIHYVLNEKEKNIEDLQCLFRIWTNKESLTKCISTGIRDIKKVSGLPIDGERIFENNSYFTKSLIFKNYSLSVTLIKKDPFELDLKEINSLVLQ